MELVIGTTSSPWYTESLKLRNQELRIPLGMDIYTEPLEEEKNQIHIFMLHEEKLIGVVVMVPNFKPEACKLRQMAVTSDFQRQGIGSVLVKALETEAINKGYKKIILHARDIAVGFYERLGYHVSSEQFTEVGIPHVKMEKEII